MASDSDYRYVATSIEGFVQQVAVSYLKNHYWFYVMGFIRHGRDPAEIDRQIIERYGIALSKWGRCRRKKKGAASLQYIRFEDTFLIMATEGRHLFLERERDAIKDAREVPIKFAGYSMGYSDGHAYVRIEREQFKVIKSYFCEVAAKRPARYLRAELRKLPFEPYKAVGKQLRGLLMEVNLARTRAGLRPLSSRSVRRRRTSVKPFDPVPGDES
jgi:hypothetical protein